MRYNRKSSRRFSRKRYSKKRKTVIVKRIGVSPEKKHVTVNVTGLGQPTNTTWVQGALGGSYAFQLVAQGTTSETRIGRKIRNICLTINVLCNVTATFAAKFPRGCIVRHALVLDTDCGTQTTRPAATDIWADGTFASVRQLDNCNRFKVLRVFDMPLIAGALCTQTGTIYLPLRGMETVYRVGSTGTTYVGDFQSNALTMWMCVSDSEAQTGTNAFTCDYHARLTFTDS